ncbi:hypothetical protein OG874_31635 [Nocardia sp. NBC_00565]|uniref:hypothetical protein n=1 Tax=Nocardia sp. NBC_00565 TaxID=2975993 RepID=UPI002E822A56|nr:hypothetical protein [Nocardia sp. NBC_00565]WUC01327.1 hypothetical protein OG874_31635 [Nocardia sp. NBC_00565]
MTEIQPERNEIAPSVRALLAAFHEDTPSKLELAPVDSVALYQRADGSLCEIGADGWLTEYDDLDCGEAITIEPTSVQDIEEP